MKKILALIMAAAMMATMASVVFAADEVLQPLAAYDFTGKKLADTTGKQADIVIDEESDSRTDAERLAGHSGRATATDNGIEMMNGFFKLPEDMFSKAEKINGITVSITYTKNSDYGWGSTWSEHLFAFSDKWITEELWAKNEAGEFVNADGKVIIEKDGKWVLKDDETVESAKFISPDRGDSFFTTRNGNVATSKTPYGGDGSWIDGSLGEDYAKEGTFATVTVTFDFSTKVASIYLDGELKKTSEESDWEKKAVLTADIVKNFKYGVVGLPVGGDWGMWSFMTVKDFTVYADTLTADQVKTLATKGWQSVTVSASNPPATGAPATGGSGDQNPTGAPKTGVATIALAVVAIGSGAYIVSKKRH